MEEPEATERHQPRESLPGAFPLVEHDPHTVVLGILGAQAPQNPLGGSAQRLEQQGKIHEEDPIVGAPERGSTDCGIGRHHNVGAKTAEVEWPLVTGDMPLVAVAATHNHAAMEQLGQLHSEGTLGGDGRRLALTVTYTDDDPAQFVIETVFALTAS
ncbi:MAG TPA: hypothetical protein DEP84_00150 [Chloroflexi bacterium]|nr:hypothetical protein [Chloroflexota bacterium]